MTMVGSQASHCMLEVVHKHSLQELCPYTSLEYLAAISTAFFCARGMSHWCSTDVYFA